MHACVTVTYPSSPPPANPHDLTQELASVCQLLTIHALHHIPCTRGVRRKKFHDDTLSRLCFSSKQAWKKWKSAGRPRSGPLYDTIMMKSSRSAVKKYVRICRAKEERALLQRRDSLYSHSDPRRFHLPRKPSQCNKLIVDGTPYTSDADLLNCWRSHFQSLSESRVSPCDTIDSLLQHSLAKEDGILDYEIAIEEVESIVKSLKNGKSCGADEISPEHLKYGGPALICWLKRLFNAMVTLEYIPPSLCHGLIIPVYKGKGRDPFNPNSYRGITLTSVIAKIFETILLHRMLPILHESNFPHISQTAGISIWPIMCRCLVCH